MDACTKGIYNNKQKCLNAYLRMNSLWLLQVRVHVGLVSAQPCRSLILLLLRYYLHGHLHLSLGEQETKFKHICEVISPCSTNKGILSQLHRTLT